MASPLLDTQQVRAGGRLALADPPASMIKQRADQFVAMTKAGYHTALFSTTPKDKFSFAAGTSAEQGSSAPKTKFSFASRARALADNAPCTTICRPAAFPAADLTPILYARPSALYGTSSMSVVVDVVELNSVVTSGLISLYVTKDPLVNLSFDGSLTSLDGRDVQNSAWSFNDSSNPNFYVLTTSQGVAAGNVLSVGLTGVMAPGPTKGILTLSSIVVVGSGGEVNVNNNADADKIDYFDR